MVVYKVLIRRSISSVFTGLAVSVLDYVSYLGKTKQMGVTNLKGVLPGDEEVNQANYIPV